MYQNDNLTEEDFDIDKEFDDLNLDSLGDELPVSDLDSRDSATHKSTGRPSSDKNTGDADRARRQGKKTKKSSAGSGAKKRKKHRRTSEQLTTFEKMGDSKSAFKTWAVDHTRILIPIVLGVLVVVIIAAALLGNRKNAAKAKEDAATALTDAAEEEIPSLEENAYPAVNELMRTYFDAYAAGDTDTIASITSGLDEEEKIKIREVSQYIESYPEINVYTKSGKNDGSYICFVVTKVKFKDQDTLIPGMQTMYVCTRDDGSLYINEDDSDADAISYIREVSTQPDVVDLNNKVQEEYNSLMADDPDLETYINDTYSKIQVAVAEALGNAQDSESADAAASDSDSSDTVSESGSSFLKANDVVNVRYSDSEDADVMGQTESGAVYPLVETKDNGWSSITYDGKTGYVKTEYFTEVSSDEATADTTETDTEETADEAEVTETENADENTEDTVTAQTASSGKAMALETVTIRKEASTDSEKVGNVWGGFSVDVLEKGDTWTKISQDGVTGYVKTEYLQFN